MREVLAISFVRLRVAWIATAAMLVASVAVGFAWRGVERRRDDVVAERLARITAARRISSVVVARDQEARVHAEALRRLADLDLPSSAAGAVEKMRGGLSRAGISKARIEAQDGGAFGSIRLVRLRVDGAARYSSVRSLLADLESRSEPIRWERLVYDGERLALEILVLHEDES